MSRLNVFLTYTDYELASYYSEAGLNELRKHANVVLNPTGRVLQGRELAEAAAGCQVILAHRSSAGSADIFEHSPDLVAFVRAAVDISTVDVAAASAHGILVTRASAGFGTAVAEMAIAMIFDLARGISRARDAYAQGQEPVLPKGLQVGSCSLGIVGHGVIGRRLVDMGLALGMRVRVHDPYADAAALRDVAASFDEVLAESDFVVCLAASTPDTRDMFGAAAFARMKQGASFLNLSRGELVDEDALEAALDSGRLRGAGLDVGRAADQKPSGRFINRPDVVVMPHVGGMTAQAREHQTMDTVRQVAALAARQVPPGAVNAATASRLGRLGITPDRTGERGHKQASAPWSAGTERACLTLPEGSVDCHHHIYDNRFPYAADTAMRLPDATVADYRLLQERLGLRRNVVVQPSSYGTDNSCLVDALRQFGRDARGVAVIDMQTTDAALRELHEAGVRGIRYNLSRPAGAGVETLQQLAERVAPLGWHVQFHTAGAAYPQLEQQLAELPVPLVIDHLGRIPQPDALRHDAYATLRRLIDGGNTWMKISGAYHDSRVGAPSYGDSGELVSAWVRHAPERVVWGTDWPHPSAMIGEKPMPDDARLLDLLAEWLPDARTLRTVMVDNPVRLYGFDAPIKAQH
ncbi:MAG TPA: amidohydrolase family protein [Bordetella sp.]|nr:amidohydrolase family protein [Bordetella sp.]